MISYVPLEHKAYLCPVFYAWLSRPEPTYFHRPLLQLASSPGLPDFVIFRTCHRAAAYGGRYDYITKSKNVEKHGKAWGRGYPSITNFLVNFFKSSKV